MKKKKPPKIRNSYFDGCMYNVYFEYIAMTLIPNKSKKSNKIRPFEHWLVNKVFLPNLFVLKQNKKIFFIRIIWIFWLDDFNVLFIMLLDLNSIIKMCECVYQLFPSSKQLVRFVYFYAKLSYRKLEIIIQCDASI